MTANPTVRQEALYPRLTAGRGAPSAEEVARNQKARLQGAMVEAVARHGYWETTLRELVGLAGISKSTFYDHFESKQDCFLSTFDEIFAVLRGRVEAAYRSDGDFRERLLAGLSVFFDLAVEEPAAARLATVDSLTLGVAGVEHRERASEAFEELIAQSFERSGPRQELSPSTAKAIVAGIRGVTYRRLRRGTQAELPGLSETLVDWALGYQQPDGEATTKAMAAAEEPAPAPPDSAVADPPWDEPPSSDLSRRALDQRARIVRGVAHVVVEGGNEALTIPAISAAAGVSNKTFYEQFDSKRDAFLAAYDELAGEALAITVAAIDGSGAGPGTLGAGMRALLEHIARNELFARLAFFELPSAGPAAMDRADSSLDGFTALIDPERLAGGDRFAPVTQEAVGSGLWALIQHEIHHGRRARLPEMAPELIRIAAAPLEAS
jgi:AcrR family transcriptional regulator